MQGGDTVVRETIQEIVQDFKDTPLPLIWQAVWSNCRSQIIAIAYLMGFVTAALLTQTVQVIATFVALVVLLVMVRNTYQAAKTTLIEEKQKGGESTKRILALALVLLIATPLVAGAVEITPVE
jgi:putative Mn2+ efflux pump MntP